MLVILKLICDLISVDTASFIDLVNRKLDTVLYCRTINRRISCCRSDTSDLKCIRVCRTLVTSAAVSASRSASDPASARS